MKSLVLLSGGLDSVTNLYKAKQLGEVKLALSFRYGQKAEVKELEAAAFFTNQLGIPHQVVDVLWLKNLGASSLTQDKLSVPRSTEVDIDNLSVSLKTRDRVWVPNRNGVFLNIAASFAESYGAQFVIPGFNLEEAQTFPDNSEDYLKAQTKAFSFSTLNQVELTCFTTQLNKAEIFKMALGLNLPWQKLWPCYQALEQWCGECESCQRFKAALYKNNVAGELIRELFKI